MKIGTVGLRRMGGNLAACLRENGHEVVGYDPAANAGDSDPLEELVSALDGQQRRVMCDRVLQPCNGQAVR